MAKGRKSTATSRIQRFLGSCGYAPNHGGDDPELQEEEVWSVIDDGRVDHFTELESIQQEESNGCDSLTQMKIPPKKIPAGGLSIAFDDENGFGSPSPTVVHQIRGNYSSAGALSSVPVNMPGWSRIIRRESCLDEDGGSETEMVPPHEYLARSRKAAARSVFEGVGRTLKGRDLRRVRDAVWSQTGFDG